MARVLWPGCLRRKRFVRRATRNRTDWALLVWVWPHQVPARIPVEEAPLLWAAPPFCSAFPPPDVDPLAGLGPVPTAMAVDVKTEDRQLSIKSVSTKGDQTGVRHVFFLVVVVTWRSVSPSFRSFGLVDIHRFRAEGCGHEQGLFRLRWVSSRAAHLLRSSRGENRLGLETWQEFRDTFQRLHVQLGLNDWAGRKEKGTLLLLLAGS